MDLVLGGYSVSCYLSLLLERSKKEKYLEVSRIPCLWVQNLHTDSFNFSSYKKIPPDFSSFKLSFLLFFKFHISLMHFLGSPAVEEKSNFSQRLIHVA